MKTRSREWRLLNRPIAGSPRRGSLFIILSFLLIAGCDKSPLERTRSDEGGALGTFGVAGSLKVFSNELFTGGGAFFYPGGENQSLAFNDQSNPVGERSIRYTWNGRPSDGSTLTFAGFDLMHTALRADYARTPGRDLRQAGYTRVRFFARGQLTTRVSAKVEAADDGIDGGVPPGCLVLSMSGTETITDGSQPCANAARLSADWNSFTIPLANPAAQLASVKDFIKVTLVYTPLPGFEENPGSGGTIYLDQIFYEP